MKFEQYITKRNSLMDQAKAALEAGDLGEFSNIKQQVEDLDNQYEAAKTAQANFQALQNNALVPPAAQQLGGAPAVGGSVNAADPFDSTEYSQAFMNFVCRGTEIPAQFCNQAQTTTTADTGAVIPQTILREIIRKVTEHGVIFQSIRHLNVPGGVQIPILDLKPTATWITEAKSSDDQKVQSNTSVTFNYYGLECKIAQSILASVATIEEFQNLFTELAAEAIIVAVEKGVFTGSGKGQMLGVCQDERVTLVVTPTAEEFASWEAWHKKIIAKIPKDYRNGTWYMAQGTFDGYIDGMTDKQGQPVGRVNYGIADGTQYRFAGRPVETVEDDVIAPYDTAVAESVVAVYMNPKDYVFNSNMQMTVVKWTDHDTNKIKNKVLLICDGKIADPNGVLLVKKHA